MREELLRTIEERGWRGRLVSIQRLQDLRAEIETRYKDGLLDEGLYREYLSGFVFGPPDTLPDAKSVILVSVPQPQVRLTFHRNGQARSFIVPPTYLYWRKTRGQVAETLAGILEPRGYRIVPAPVPHKLLAVRSGLAAYGRNNITYVDGMGSFHRPVTFFSDVPCVEDEWREPRVMERCENCVACLRNCPTGAITAERFLLHAERCLTFLNEKPGDVPFPDWVDPSWHNCVVGCMRCQSVCPEDKGVLAWVEDGGEFSEDETALLLDRVPLEDLPAGLADKLKQSDLVDYYDHLARNLRALLLPA
jgi:epoxyqueuosine reductase